MKKMLKSVLFYTLIGLMLLMVVVMIYIIHHRDEEMLIGTNLWPGYELLYVAREKGFLQDKIRLIEYNTTSEVLRSLKTGVINAAALTLDEAIKAYDKGINIEIVMIFDTHTGQMS